MSVSFRSIVVSSLVLRGMWVGSALPQESKGRITAGVVDASKGVLPGAQVELQPGGQTATSDGHGEFTIANIPPGKYTLTVSYVGFEPFSTEVNITGEAAQRVEATLQIGKQSEMVTVRGEREHGEAEASNIGRAADDIFQVLPDDVITSLPNTNIAHARGKRPGVSLERAEGQGRR